jgi:type III pantothenate kinase
MDISLLALGVGNSRLAVGVFTADELQHVVRVPLSGDLAGALGDELKRIPGADGRIVVAASVSPPFNSRVSEIVKTVTGQTVQWIGPDIDVPIEVATQKPAETGIDRILNVAAAFEQLGKACIVVDAGTALTVDCCNDNGDFLGGAILPGMSMMLDALAEKTAGVGRVTFAVPTGPIGDSTSAAVSHGVYYAIRGLVREMAENYATQVGQWPEIIATGGDAAQLFEGWELIHAISPDLGLYGIALAYADHHIRHET